MSQEGSYSRTSDYGSPTSSSAGERGTKERRESQGNTERRFIHIPEDSLPSRMPIDEAVNSAFDEAHVKEVPGISPELIAQITQNVIQQLKSTGVADSVQTPVTAVPSTAYQQPRVGSPSSPSAGESPPPRVYTPPSPLKHSETHDSLSDRVSPEYPSNIGRVRSSSNLSSMAGEDIQRGRPPPQRQYTAEEATTLEKIWGKLFDTDDKPTPRLGQFLRGVATHLIDDNEPRQSLVVTPEKMLEYYRVTKITSEIYPWNEIFDDAQSSISRMYRSLEIQHHLVQEGDKFHIRPDIPGLTAAGFEKWQTMMIRAHPEQELERLQKALVIMAISNPDDKKERFPKEIPQRLFPKQDNREIRQFLIDAIETHANISLPHREEVQTPKPEPRRRRGSDAISHASFNDGTAVSEGGRPRASTDRERISTKQPTGQVSEDYLSPTISTPIERERKPYVAQPGGGKLYDDFVGPPLQHTTSAASGLPPPPPTAPPGLNRSNSGAARPINIPPPPPNGPSVHRMSASEYNSPLNAPHLRDPMGSRRRNHSPLRDDMRRSDTDIRGFSQSYEPPSYMPRGGFPPPPPPGGPYAQEDFRYDDERRYGRSNDIRRDDFTRGGSPNRRGVDPQLHRGSVPGGHMTEEEYYRRSRDDRARNW